MDDQTKTMLDEILNSARLSTYEREQVEDKYAGKLPLASGTIAYSHPSELRKNLTREIFQWVQDWRHAESMADREFATPAETCRQNIQRGLGILSYLRKR